MKINASDYYLELTRDMGLHDSFSPVVEEILWRMNDDKNFPKPKHFEVNDGEKITFRSVWKTLSMTQKRNLIKDARGREMDSEFLSLATPNVHSHRVILPAFLRSVPSF